MKDGFPLAAVMAFPSSNGSRKLSAMSVITGADCSILGKFPKAPARSWAEVLTESDRSAFVRVHRAIKEVVNGAASRHPEFSAATTSGFFETSGIRLQRPKDLWGALSNQNSRSVVGMPQIFVIASGSGVEVGFAAAIHRGQFSSADVKSKLKQAVPRVFDAFPAPDAALANELSQNITESGGWWLREKTRMTPFAAEYETLKDLLSDIHSIPGKQRGSAAISRYYSLDTLTQGNVNLTEQFEEAVQLFAPLMAHVRSYQTGSGLNPGSDELPAALRQSAQVLLDVFSKEQALDSEVARMARSIIKTVKWSNGQIVAQTIKSKNTTFKAQSDIEDFLKVLWERQAGSCALTGAALPVESANPWMRVSCDRIDSGRGYESENMQLTLWAANRFKGAAPEEDWTEMRAAIRVMGLAIERQESGAA